MSFINKYLRNFEPYKTASHKVWTVPADERKIILKLDWNEATIPPAPAVTESIHALLQEDCFFNLYPQTYNGALLEALAKYLQVSTENVQFFSSSDSLHEYIAKLYITVGDPVLILGPSYDNFRLTAEVCGGRIFYYNMDMDLQFNAEAFAEKIRELQPSLVYICNPNNPTGTCHSVEYIQSLLERFQDTLFLVDEAYAEFSGVSAKNLVLRYENILISRTMSKAFALANFRFGYLIASKENIRYISSIRNAKNITTFAQTAALAALSDIEYMQRYVDEVNLAKCDMQKYLAQFAPMIRCNNGEGNFIMLIFDCQNTKESFFNFLLERNIYVRNLTQTMFLKTRCIRMSIGTREQMNRVKEAIAEFVKQCGGNQGECL